MKRNGMLVIYGLILFAVFLVLSAIVFSGTVQSLDTKLALLVNGGDFGSAFVSMMILLSIYGREWFWIPVVAVMLILGTSETKALAIELTLLFAAGLVAGDVSKALVYRPRPFETLGGIVARVPTDTDSSYPSGHAIIVSIGAVYSLAKFRKNLVAGLFCLEAGLVCYSRVFVGVHYLTDVAGGALLGASIVFVGLFVLQKYLSRYVASLASFLSRITLKSPVDL